MIPIVVIAILGFPISLVYKAVKRRKDMEMIFEKNANGEEVQVYHNKKDYLTSVSLPYVKIQLDPIYFIGITLDFKN